MRNKFLAFCSLLILNNVVFSQEISLEPGYSDYDKHKAVITCMQYMYVEKHQQEPAEENLFPLCEQRFLALSRTLPHSEFIKARASNDEKLLKVYYDALFGIPAEEIKPDASIPQSPNIN